MEKKRIYFLKLFVLLLTLPLILSACFKEDEKVPVHEAGDVLTKVIPLGEKYTSQFYYDLESQDFVSTNSIFDWDLAFESSDTGWHIVMNGAKSMHAGNTYNKVFESITGDAGVKMHFDPSSGELDSSAIGLWYYTEGNETISNGDVYVIDRGLDLDFSSLGKKKISIDIQNNDYLFRYADLDGNNENTITIRKDQDYNFIYFSFDEGIIEIAPKKDKWSMLFTKYATLLYTTTGEPYPYTVTGAILNRNKVRVAIDTLDFESISLADTANHVFTDRSDIIGYDWKVYSLDEDKYVIVPDRNYIVRDKDALYYKMRFIDFYDDLGVRGSIKLEVARL
jgi:hypothetical protein